jgi:hypothetical protein
MHTRCGSTPDRTHLRVPKHKPYTHTYIHTHTNTHTAGAKHSCAHAPGGQLHCQEHRRGPPRMTLQPLAGHSSWTAPCAAHLQGASPSGSHIAKNARAQEIVCTLSRKDMTEDVYTRLRTDRTVLGKVVVRCRLGRSMLSTTASKAATQKA